MSKPLVSILIVNWNTRELVLQCLDSLRRGAGDVACEVIVVDNGSVDGSGDVLDQRADVRLIRNTVNLGYAAAVNQAYRASSGEYVLLLNSDVHLTPGALTTLARFLDVHPTAAGAAPLYVNPDGTPQPFHFRFPSFKMILANGSAIIGRILPGSRHALRTYYMLDDDFSRPTPVPQPSASCLLLRRSLLPRDHIFDERYPIFFNDVQLARAFSERGLDLWVTPDATVVHEAHASTGRLGSAGRRQYLGSLILMLSETEPPIKVWLYRAVIFLENIPRWLLRRSSALGFRDLWRALSGDVGPLPLRPQVMRRGVP